VRPKHSNGGEYQINDGIKAMMANGKSSKRVALMNGWIV
jgi:dTDP-glucose pyrophosphorylase